jgi:hypothetical protein
MTDGRRCTTFTSETSVVYGLPSIVGWGNVLLAYRRRESARFFALVDGAPGHLNDAGVAAECSFRHP